MTGVVLLDIIIYITIVALILMFMIAVHELGHYLAGKMLGFKINEFAIGFGKPIFKRVSKKTGEVFSIRWFPLGGFCAFAGDEAAAGEGGSRKDAKKREDKVDAPTPKGVEFQKQPPWKRLIVLFAGGFFNFICAILFAIVLMMMIGYYNSVSITLKATSEGDPNPNTALFQNVERIYAIGTTHDNLERFTMLNPFGTVISKYAETDELVYHVRFTNGTMGHVEGKFATGKFLDSDGKEYTGLGIESMTRFQPLGFFNAIKYGVIFCFDVSWMLLSFLWLLITGRMGLFGNVGGPTATVAIMYNMVSINIVRSVFILIPLISINLALFNLLPIPALDGARMVFIGIEWIRKKPINPVIEGRIHLIGMIALLAFVLLADVGYWIVQGRGIYLLNGRLLL